MAANKDYKEDKYDGVDMNSKHVPSKYDEEYDKYYAQTYNQDNEYNDSDSDSDNNNDSDNEYVFDKSYEFKTYEELIEVTKQEDTPDKINNIVIALIKAITIKKCKETSFKFDFSLGTRAKWIEAAENFNNTNVDVDYRMLIDETAIVCYLVNDELIE
jgi:hypothetical protein